MVIRLSVVLVVVSFLLSMVSGCSSLTRNPVPIDKIDQAETPGYTHIRAWAGEFSEVFQDDIMLSIRQESKDDYTITADGKRQYHILILSGGGENGAFGAGLLYGWSKSGKRPKFKMVTGISTGALIAPMAFLGSEYDDILKRAYTEISSKDIYKTKSIFALFSDESLADTTPLKNLVKFSVTDEMVKEIGKAHQAGRRLYIGTTHMDADRLVVWNMGKIAASGREDAPELFRNIMVASASLPGAFPPVYFDAIVDGQKYDEMHVDGGLNAQMIYYGATMNLVTARKQMLGKTEPQASKLYIIRNGKLSPESKSVGRDIGSIMGRTVTSMTKASGIGDLYRIYTYAQRDGVDFNYTAIPPDYEWKSDEQFDPVEMNALFELGHDMAMLGIKWKKLPHGLE